MGFRKIEIFLANILHFPLNVSAALNKTFWRSPTTPDYYCVCHIIYYYSWTNIKSKMNYGVNYLTVDVVWYWYSGRAIAPFRIEQKSCYTLRFHHRYVINTFVLGKNVNFQYKIITYVLILILISYKRIIPL